MRRGQPCNAAVETTETPTTESAPPQETESAASGLGSTSASEQEACNRIEITKGSVSWRRAPSIAEGAISTGQGTPNDSVNIRGYDCYVYPYEVDRSRSGTTFNTKLGPNGDQTG